MATTQRKKVLFHDVGRDTARETAEVKGAPMPTLKHSLFTIPFHHLLVLVGMFYQGLTTNTCGTLWSGLLTILPLQLVYNYFIIQNTQSNLKKQKGDNVGLLVVGALVVALMSLGVLYASLVLLGAPIFAYWQETFLFAAHLAVITLDPLFVVFKFDFARLRAIFGTDTAIRSLMSNAVVALALGGLVGAWLGVLPIPLDWDRPWQQWPVTLVVGLYLGTVIGGMISLFC